MAEYYFDIETYSPGEKPNPEEDKIITIQFQRIDLRTGKPREELVILKEWESSEEQIVKEFYNRFFAENCKIWDFVPVGFNLNFEWEALISKFNKYLGLKLNSKNMHYSRPHIDLKSTTVLLNDGTFKYARLDKFTSKKSDGSVINGLYSSGKTKEIEDYIKEEADAFLDYLQKIKKHLDIIAPELIKVKEIPNG